MDNLTSLIVGPGAVGSIVGLHAQQYSQVFVHPHRSGLALAQSVDSGKSHTPLLWQLYNEPVDIDIIWVCCKANQVMSVVPAIAEQHQKAAIILLHNGMGPQQSLSNQFGERCLWGYTTCGAIKLPDGNFLQTSFGSTPISRPTLTNHRFQTLAHCLANRPSDDPLSTELVDDINDKLWLKVTINAAVNYITAYHQIPNGELLQTKYRLDIETICEEANNVRAACGFKRVENIVDIILDIARNSRSNRSSMAEDIRRGRPTENDFINGYLISQAKNHNIATPALHMWYDRISELNQRC